MVLIYWFRVIFYNYTANWQQTAIKHANPICKQ